MRDMSTKHYMTMAIEALLQLLQKKLRFYLKVRYFCDPGTRTLLPGSWPDILTRVPRYTQVRGPALGACTLVYLAV